MRNQLLLLFFSSLVVISSLSAGEINLKLEFPSSDISIEKRDGYDFVILSEYDFISEIGEPMLPARSVHVAIPSGMILREVLVTRRVRKEIPGSYFVYPSQPHRPISDIGHPEFVQPKQAVYSSSAPYPGELLEAPLSGYLAGHSVTGIRIFPVEYVPSERKLYLYTELDLKLLLDTAPQLPPRIAKRSRRAEELIANSVRSLVLNPEDVEDCVAEQVLQSSTLASDLLEYVIITRSYYFEEFQELVDWKTQKGIHTVLRDIDWILQNYTGYDDPEILRNYIRELWADSGTVWILLGGDAEVVPYRRAYCHAGDATRYLPCDSYFANLNGTWDADGDHTYGGVDDEVDFYPDLWIGRATVDSDEEATRFVTKVIAYEKNPPTDYQTKALFFTAHLDGSTDPIELKEYIDDQYVPEYFGVDYLSDVASSVVCNYLDQGYNIANHAGHGNSGAMYTNWSSDYLDNSDMNDLTNSPRYTGILYTVGCYCGAFDYSDCIGEKFLEAQSGGGFFIGNSSYGWYSPGHPLSGSSAAFDRRFFRSLFQDLKYHLGHTLADSKQHLASQAASNSYYRWCYYALNLFGDPETPIWTDTPLLLQVTHPDTIKAGWQDPFTVTVHSGGNPVINATVCLWKTGEIYLVEPTNLDGEITFYPSPSTPGTLSVTVTKHNYLPYDGRTIVFSYATPIAQFSADATTGYAPLSVQFLDQSTGIIGDWFWQFGDGDYSYDSNPVHTYHTGDRFDVTLIVSNPGGADSLFKKDYIVVRADTVAVVNSFACPGQIGKVIRIEGVTSDSLAGYGLAMYFDTTFLDVDTITLDGTCGEGAQFSLGGVGFDTSLGLGYVTWGVVYSFTPPWIQPGSDYFFNLIVNIEEDVPFGPIALDLENDVGRYDTDNTFTTWDEWDIYPILVDGTLTILEAVSFIRGDVNSSTDITMSDAVYLLRYLYVPGSPSPPCMDAADVNDDGTPDMADGVYLLKYLYVPGNPEPSPPCCTYPGDCGVDPTSDALDCGSHPCAGKTRAQHHGGGTGESQYE